MTAYREAHEVLVELDQAGLELFAPPPGWVLRIAPPGIVSKDLKERVTKHKDRLTWWTIKRIYAPSALTDYYLNTVADGHMDMKQRADIHRKNANKLLELAVETEELQVEAVAYRAIMIAARLAAKKAFPGGLDT